MRVLLQHSCGLDLACGQNTHSLDMVLGDAYDAKPREILTTAMPGFWVILLPQEGTAQSLALNHQTPVASPASSSHKCTLDFCLSPSPTF